MQRMNWMACHILLMSRMDLPDTQEARVATATTQSKNVWKGAKLRYGIRFCALNAMQWFCMGWGPNDFGPTSMKICWCIFQPAKMSAKDREISVMECRFSLGVQTVQKLTKNSPRQSLPSVTGVAYILGSGEEGLQLQPENPKNVWPWKTPFESGKNWKNVVRTKFVERL